MDFLELIKKRYACRNFDGSEIDRNVLEEIIRDASCCPSAKNTQPWRFFISTTKEQNAKIANALSDENKHAFLQNASAFVLIYESIPNCIACTKYGNDRFVPYDIGQMIAYLTLSAKNRGVDSCIIGWINDDKLFNTTNISMPCKIAVALGRAKDDVVLQKNRKNYKDLIIN
ncbi:MAG: hypothetical protein DBX59_03950 [Bacillota bacterium]|nr:MAG: hypothetical protein DBX59_03950 [Bacillota bacterium]